MTPRPSPDDAARAARMAKEYFMQWGVIDTLPILPDNDAELAERWLTDLLLTFAAQAAQRATEECIRAICVYCDDGWLVDGDGLHTIPREGFVTPGHLCRATALRARHAATKE